MGIGVSVATIPRWNGIAVRACFGMAEECANALIELRADDVFELAGLGVSLGVVNRKSVFEKALREAMAAHDITGAPATAFG